MKKINLAVSLMFLFMACLAQRSEPLHKSKDQQSYQGCTIRLIPAMSGSYGYTIVKGKQLVALESRNPFTGTPDGLKKKEDAYKVAQWQIRQLVAGKRAGMHLGKDVKLPLALLQKIQLQGSRGPLINQRISTKVAEELHINMNK